MAVVVPSGATPRSFASGAFTIATLQGGPSWQFTITPTLISSNTAYDGFHALLATNDNGGLYIVNRRIELYNGSGSGTLVGNSSVISWAANAVITIRVNLAAGTNASSIVVSGAATGNGTTTFTSSGTYFTASTLGVGQFSNTGTFTFNGTISAVDDLSTILTAAGTTANATSSAAVATPGTVSLAAAGASATATASPATLDTPGNLTAAGAVATASASPATATPGAVSRSAAGSAATATASPATLSTASVALGVHGFDAQNFGSASRPATVTLTFTAGSMILVAVGGKSSDISQGPTSSRGETFRRLDQVHDYPDFAGYGTAVYCCYSAVGGLTTITVPVTLFDENTTFVWEIKQAKNIRSLAWSQLANSGAGTTQTSGSVVVTAGAVLSYLWWGSSPVVTSPPGPPSFSAAPNRGAVIESYLVNNSSGEVQGALAIESVTAPGSYNVTWTHAPAQGAQLWVLVAQEGEQAPGAVATASAAPATITSTISVAAAGANATASAAPATISASATALGAVATAASSPATAIAGPLSIAAPGSAATAAASSATIASVTSAAASGAAATAGAAAAQITPGPVARSAPGASASASSGAAQFAPGPVIVDAVGASATASASAATVTSSAVGDISAPGAVATASASPATIIPGPVSTTASGAVATARVSAAVASDVAARLPRANYTTTVGPSMPTTLISGDLEPDLLVPLLEPHATIAAALQPIDLTGAIAVDLVWRVPGSTDPDLILPAQISGAATAGQVAHTWVAGETDAPGLHRYRVRITWPSSEHQHVPSDGTSYTLMISPAAIP